ncbi:MAG: deoxyribose-phosphate aldolase [Halovenus sp.]
MDDIPGRIEHTVLGPLTSWDDVTDVLDTAIAHGMRACVPACYVDEATDYAPGVEIATVIGFPHGQHSLETKCTEANQVWKAGAAEVDLVPNLGRAAAGDIEGFESELEEIAATVPVPVKVILEAPLFDDDQLRELAAAAAGTDIDYLKTSTGFTEGGATVSDVELLSEYDDVKASGGIGSWAFAKELLAAGADRIGASSGDVIVEQYREQTGRG